MVTAIVLVVLGAGMVTAFGLTLRLARRAPHAAARRGRPSSPAAGVDRLEVGAELVHDDQRWDVIGVQHVQGAEGGGVLRAVPGGDATDGDSRGATTEDDPGDGPWSAWHLDDRGQSGWMATSPGVDHVLFAVRAERPELLDPAAERLTWRDHEWVRIEDGSWPADAEGERRLPRGPRVALPDAAVARTVFTREDLRSRRLVLERAAGEDGFHAWIGGLVPAQMVDVWPREARGDAPAPGPSPAASADATPAQPS